MYETFKRNEDFKIKPLYKSGILTKISDMRDVNGSNLIKIVVDIYEEDLNNSPYKLEYYIYDNNLIQEISSFKVGGFICVKYFTKSKLNRKTNLYYTNNIATAIEPIEDEVHLINFNKQFNKWVH